MYTLQALRHFKQFVHFFLSIINFIISIFWLEKPGAGFLYRSVFIPFVRYPDFPSPQYSPYAT
ncbi:MAG: hypothetical protein D3925_02140 [Candidatus Electrothrix sp. AR5]|nr:hypothetical protein [Candidatus Electrothrix sp. AR5]